MSRIDTENAKQIRNPMDVLITMEVPDEGITLTYSGYSSAKVADGSLGNAWPMRLLADLKGDGFPLDGSRVVYNSATSASETNGKIGVRSNIGQTVSVTVTGSANIVSLSIFATGATSVTYNGTTSAIVGGQVIIPVGATSITLTFNPASTTDRIEISQIVSGTSLRITNDTLIKAVVSLRSDLSIIDPTLPESELNIEVYNDADISEAVANLPDETPIFYQAGYANDMSPLRKFYVAGQVTWADNVLSIHAVDAVHLLDIETIPLAIKDEFSQKEGTNLNQIFGLFVYLITSAGVDVARGYAGFSSYYRAGFSGLAESSLVERGVNHRTMIAEIMNLFNFEDIDTSTFYGSSVFWPSYVDAGIPTVNWRKPTKKWTIKESDCGEININRERTISQIEANLVTVKYLSPSTQATSAGNNKVGNAQWYKNNAGFVELDMPLYVYEIGVQKSKVDAAAPDYSVLPIIPASNWSDGTGYPFAKAEAASAPITQYYRPNFAQKLIDSETVRGDFTQNWYPLQVVPWAITYNTSIQGVWRWTSQSSAWNGLVSAGVIDGGEDNATLDVFGWGPVQNAFVQTFYANRTGVKAKITPNLKGAVYLGSYPQGGVSDITEKVYPDKAIKTLFNRSNETKAFTWKGDPRMQPRDVVEWQRLDGTTETITLENITLTHEKGGTVAEITARKGIV